MYSKRGAVTWISIMLAPSFITATIYHTWLEAVWDKRGLSRTLKWFFSLQSVMLSTPQCRKWTHIWGLLCGAVIKIFCCTALTSAGWVQMTINPRHCPPTKQCGGHLIAAIFPRKNVWSWASNPGPQGEKQVCYPLCYAAPIKQTF